MSAPSPQAFKKVSAGKRDLSAAVATIHSKPRGTPNPDGIDHEDVEDLPAHLLLAAGDEEGRESFFDHDDTQETLLVQHRQVHLVLANKVSLLDYRTPKNKRTHRSMITIPPKLRESIQGCFGGADQAHFPMTTAIIALADYAAMMLKRDGKCLFVDAASDPHAVKRKAARRTVRQANSKK